MVPRPTTPILEIAFKCANTVSGRLRIALLSGQLKRTIGDGLVSRGGTLVAHVDLEPLRDLRCAARRPGDGVAGEEALDDGLRAVLAGPEPVLGRARAGRRAGQADGRAGREWRCDGGGQEGGAASHQRIGE